MADAPFIESLLLTDFRSYPSLDARFDGRPVVLYGENGAGKTNLLEAVSLLSPGRGLRRAKLPDLARIEDGKPAPLWGVAARIGGAEDPINIGTGQYPGNAGRRQIRIDGAGASGTAMAKLLTINWLTPAQDRLFTGPASDRRKFLDRLCLIHEPAHGRTFLAYEKSRAERSRLFSDGIDDPYWFDALEIDMAERGAKIAAARWKATEKLRAEIAARPEGHFPKAVIALAGEAEELYARGLDEIDVCAHIKKALKDDRALDRRAGRTLRGVHKSDLLVTHLAKQMPASACSTGEQKALLIGLIIAHARAQTQRRPILLLDEVAAHLDEVRRAALAEELLDLKTQVFLTGTDKDLFSAFNGRAQMFHVAETTLKSG